MKWNKILSFSMTVLQTIFQVNSLNHNNTINVSATTAPRIVGGRQCKIRNFPYMVSVRHTIDNRHYCGGTLLSSLWVLTAAHCCPHIYKPRAMKVVAGSTKKSISWGVQSSLVYKCYKHSDYDQFVLLHDIALLNLEFPIKPNDFIDYVKLPKETEESEESLKKNCSKSMVIGWGMQYPKDINGKPIILPIPKHNPRLQCVEIPVVSRTYCEEKYEVIIPDTILCGYARGKDACQEDSGGPLLCNGIQYGIVSGGEGCAFEDIPGLYTRVDKYITFIASKTRKSSANRFVFNWTCLLFSTIKLHLCFFYPDFYL